MKSDETIDSDLGMEMTIVPSSRCFTVPDHWIVEDRRRKSGKSAGIFDRYYYEPETGCKFRSLRSVQVYLADEEVPLRKMLESCKKKKLTHKKKMEIVARSTRTNRSSYKLPDGWIIEGCLRSSGASAGQIDKYYIEPGTGLKFRSLISVKRHLSKLDLPPIHYKSKPDDRLVLMGAEKQELQQKRNMAIVAHDFSTTRTSNLEIPDDQTLKEFLSSSPNYDDLIGKFYHEQRIKRKFQSRKDAEILDLATCPQNFGSQINVSGQKIKTLSFNSTKPPVRIKWVHSDPENDTWSPFVGESMVQDSVKQQWVKIFMLITEVDDPH